MGLHVPEHQSPGRRSLVAFDFDGTLTTRDSFTAFLAWRAGPIRYALGLFRLIPALGFYVVRRDRGRLKAAAVREFLSGMTPDALAQAAEAFADAKILTLLRPDALSTWRRWKDSGCTMLIVTASPELVVQPFAVRLGADGLIGTRLKISDQGQVTGALEGANCRGAEKVRRITSQFGTQSLAAAYGDTPGDHEMLHMASVRGYRVFKGRP